MRILGIDPGYAIVGFGVIETDGVRHQLIRCGAINTPAGAPIASRLLQIADDMAELINIFRPEEVAVEELFFSQNVTTGIAVAQARGVLLMTVARAGLSISEYTPSQVKQAVVGYGRAEKKQVMELTKTLLNLQAVPKPDDAADALAVAICHARSAFSALGKINR